MLYKGWSSFFSFSPLDACEPFVSVRFSREQLRILQFVSSLSSRFLAFMRISSVSFRWNRALWDAACHIKKSMIIRLFVWIIRLFYFQVKVLCEMVRIFVIAFIELFVFRSSECGVPGSVFRISAVLVPHSWSCVETILLPHPISITEDYTARRTTVHTLPRAPSVFICECELHPISHPTILFWFTIWNLHSCHLLSSLSRSFLYLMFNGSLMCGCLALLLPPPPPTH